MDWDLAYGMIGHSGEAISWSQMSIRGLVIFVIGLVFVRVAGERVFGKWGALDILLAIIIGSNLSRAITGGAPFVPTLCATAVLIALHAGLAYAAVLWPGLGGWLKGWPTRLIQDGQIDHRALRRHAVGQGDLQQALRRAGQIDPSHVQAAFLERNGDISIILSSATDRGTWGSEDPA
jgi:uncharacterized membrane protein YcaP (DUF421 family)